MAPDALKSPAEPGVRGKFHWPWATGIVAAGAIALYRWPGAAGLLVYDRERVLGGEWWPLVTSHWVHFSASHLVWNIAVLVPVGAWCESLEPKRTRWLYLIAPPLIGLTLLAGDAGLARYAGLSGIATAAVVLLALTQVRRGPDRWIWIVVLGLVAAKVVAESIHAGPLFAAFADASIRPVPLAHLAGGAVAALVHGAMAFGRERKFQHG
jgi:rhomboid family GlyGly-CTERM serine protease